MATEKTEITNLSEASGVSANDYVMIDSPTQGARKVLASKFQGGGGNSTFYGSSAPTSDIGSDGDLYFELNEDGSIFKAYVKIYELWKVYVKNPYVAWTKITNARATSTSGQFSGQNAVFSLRSYANYKNIGADNIIVQWRKYYHSDAFPVTPCTISKLYDSSTGDLSITTPICPFYQGNYTVDIFIVAGSILKKQVAPSSMNGNIAHYDLTDIDEYSQLTINDIAFEMDKITHSSSYNLTHNITYSYDSSNGIFTVSTDTSILVNSEATIAIKRPS